MRQSGQDLLDAVDPETRIGAARALGARAGHRGSFVRLLERMQVEQDPQVLTALSRALLRHFSVTTAGEMVGGLLLLRRDAHGPRADAIAGLVEELRTAMGITPEQLEEDGRRFEEAARRDPAPASPSRAISYPPPVLPGARPGVELRPDLTVDPIARARELLAAGSRVKAVALLQDVVKRGEEPATLAAAWLGAILTANGQAALAEEYLARLRAPAHLPEPEELEPVRQFCRDRGLSPIPRELREKHTSAMLLPPSSSGSGATGVTTLDAKTAAFHLPGRFADISLIGSGGMGVVFRARDMDADEVVAIKMLAPSHWKDQRARKRFTLEARALARLSHPAVLRVLSIERSDVPFFTMELLEGQPLDALLNATPPAPGTVLGYLLPVLDALDHCHEAGLVHRDVKPRNIFVTRAGGVRLMDFGIVKSAGTSSITTVGTIVGTPHYMAPEQLVSGRVDRRADIYAIGVTLFQMLTGVLPFEDPIEVFSRAVPSIRDRVDLPVELDQIVQRCLRRSPSERYLDCRELAAALRPFAVEEAPSSAAPSSRDVFAAVLMDCLERGAMTEREQQLLLAVRRVLGISAEEHQHVFREIRSRVKGEREGTSPVCIPAETLFRMVVRRHLRLEERDPDSGRLLDDVGRLLEIPRPRRRELERAAAQELMATRG